jgi:hypothetical protein
LEQLLESLTPENAQRFPAEWQAAVRTSLARARSSVRVAPMSLVPKS